MENIVNLLWNIFKTLRKIGKVYCIIVFCNIYLRCLNFIMGCAYIYMNHNGPSLFIRTIVSWSLLLASVLHYQLSFILWWAIFPANMRDIWGKQQEPTSLCRRLLFHSCPSYWKICFSTFPTPNFLQSLHQLNYLMKPTLLVKFMLQYHLVPFIAILPSFDQFILSYVFLDSFC